MRTQLPIPLHVLSQELMTSNDVIKRAIATGLLQLTPEAIASKRSEIIAWQQLTRITDAGPLIGMATTTVFRLVRQGILPVVKHPLSGRPRITEEGLAILRKHQTQTLPTPLSPELVAHHDDTPEGFVSITDIMSYLGAGEDALRRLLRATKVQTRREKGRLFYRIKDVLALEKKNKFASIGTKRRQTIEYKRKLQEERRKARERRMTLQEFADRYGLTKQAVHNLVARNRLPWPPTAEQLAYYDTWNREGSFALTMLQPSQVV